jgi:hypothetical protein
LRFARLSFNGTLTRHWQTHNAHIGRFEGNNSAHNLVLSYGRFGGIWQLYW